MASAEDVGGVRGGGVDPPVIISQGASRRIVGRTCQRTQCRGGETCFEGSLWFR